MSLKTTNVPSFTIQCDWLEALREDGRCWLRFDPSVNDGQPARIDTFVNACEGDVLVVDHADLNAVWNGYTCLVVSHRDYRYQTAFHVAHRTIAGVHKGKAVECLSVTDDGDMAFSYGGDGVLCAWTLADAHIVQRFSGHVSSVYCCSTLKSGQLMLSGGADFQTRLWTLANGQCAKSYKGHKKYITCVRPVGIGKMLASSSSDGRLLLYCAASEEVIIDVDCKSAITNFVIASKCANVVMETGHVLVNKNSSAKYVEELNSLMAVIVTESGKCLAMCLTSCESVCLIAGGVSLSSCCVLQNTPYIVAGCVNGSIALCSLSGGCHILSCGNKTRINDICALKDASVAVAYADGAVTIFKVDNEGTVSPMYHSLTGSDLSAVTVLCFNNKSNFLYAACKDGHVRTYTV